MLSPAVQVLNLGCPDSKHLLFIPVLPGTAVHHIFLNFPCPERLGRESRAHGTRAAMKYCWKFHRGAYFGIQTTLQPRIDPGTGSPRSMHIKEFLIKGTVYNRGFANANEFRGKRSGGLCRTEIRRACDFFWEIISIAWIDSIRPMSYNCQIKMRYLFNQNVRSNLGVPINRPRNRLPVISPLLMPP